MSRKSKSKKYFKKPIILGITSVLFSAAAAAAAQSDSPLADGADSGQPAREIREDQESYDEYNRLTAELKQSLRLADDNPDDGCCTCPENIKPAVVDPQQTSAELIENIILFMLNDIGHKEEFHNKSNISCYFQGNFIYGVSGYTDLYSEEQQPDWGKTDLSFLRTNHDSSNIDNSLRIYYEPKYGVGGTSLHLNGHDEHFVTLSVLEKYFPNLHVNHGSLKNDLGTHWSYPGMRWNMPSYISARKKLFFPLNGERKYIYIYLRHNKGDGRFDHNGQVDYSKANYGFDLTIHLQ